MVFMLRLSHSVHFAVCTVTFAYSDSSTVHGFSAAFPGVRGVRSGNGLGVGFGVLRSRVRWRRLEPAGTGVRRTSGALW